MPRLGEFSTLPVTVPLGDKALHIVIREPSGETALAFLTKAEGEGERAKLEAIIDALQALIVEWDLEDDDGNPYPVTREALLRLPLRLLRHVFDAVMRAVGAEGES